MKNIKKLGVFSLMLAMLIPVIFNASSSVDADELKPMKDVAPIREVSRNDGGGAYGSNSSESNVENGVQYYRDGDIIEVKVSLPENHGSKSYLDVVRYDNTKLKLVSPFKDIKKTMSDNYLDDAGWMNFVDYYGGETNQIVHYGVGDHDYVGGTVVKMYFEVKAGVESVEGTEITFEFPYFQSSALINGVDSYTHIGFDPDKYDETRLYADEPITVIAKTPSVTAVKPELTLTTDKVTVYEGDLVNPQDYIQSASDSSDATITKNSVVISEGTGENGSHQPVAGTYTFKYTVTNSSGETTEKTVAMEVVKRTYNVVSVESEGQNISVPAGTTDTKFKEIIEGLRGKEFKVNVKGNDGSEFQVDGVVVSGLTDTYTVDGNDVLKAQEFNMTLDLALLTVFYNEKGERELLSVTSRANFATTIDDGTAEVVIKITVGSASVAPGDDNNNNNNGNNNNTNGTTTGKDTTSNASIASGNNSGSGAATGDTTNVAGLMALLAFSGIVLVGNKLRKTYN